MGVGHGGANQQQCRWRREKRDDALFGRGSMGGLTEGTFSEDAYFSLGAFFAGNAMEKARPGSRTKGDVVAENRTPSCFLDSRENEVTKIICLFFKNKDSMAFILF